MPSWLPINNSSILAISRGWKKLLQRSKILLYSSGPCLLWCTPSHKIFQSTSASLRGLKRDCLVSLPFHGLALHHSKTFVGSQNPLKKALPSSVVVRKVRGDLENDPFGMWQISFISPPVNHSPIPLETWHLQLSSVAKRRLDHVLWGLRTVGWLTGSNGQVQNTPCAHWKSLEKVKWGKQPTDC